ncbi:hypothetical protein [Enterococcus faecalis]|uniref:hypothetical protein n=1 Tax=Enterococcus faecalis TaxID=1351 RepID=UPI002DBBD6C3|nr:hypothetical protein [Enterococcus faecalis]MEB7954610.1 hypothetical protein [Enterococcus faecalis]MEB7964754.1 hypothetical protein [Enterococcus faecalis]
MYEEQTQEAKQIFSEVMLKSLQSAKDNYLEKNQMNEKFVYWIDVNKVDTKREDT